MKKLRKINLVNLSKDELDKKELNRLLGGELCCICGCPGPSGSIDNHGANTAAGYTSGGAGFPGGAYS